MSAEVRAAVVRDRIHRLGVWLNPESGPLLTITPTDGVAHALYASTITVHTEVSSTRILDLHTLPWVSALILARFLPESCVEACPVSFA